MPGRLILNGLYGSAKGQKYFIREGQTVTIGRSRSCDIRLEGTISVEEEVNIDHATKHFQTISRKHLKITFHNETRVEVEDLSANGTLLDGDWIEKVIITDITTETHTLLLGSREKFTLSWEAC